jgi:DNA-binding winged helix-turn-helix (wHTH) protein
VATYQFGHFHLNVATRQLFRDAEPIPLTAKAFDTLVVLVTHHGHVVTKDELMKAVWHDAIVSDDSLTQNIRAIRRALGDDAGEPVYITTIARRGYRFIQPVQEVAAGEPEPAPLPRSERVAPAPLSRAVPPQARPRWLLVAAGVVTGALAAYFVSTAVWQPAAATPGDVLRFSVSAPPGTTLESGGALSRMPPGRHGRLTAARSRSLRADRCARSIA